MALGLYLGLAFWTTWPVVREPFSTLPLGKEPVATVPLFNLWTIWWNTDRASHGYVGYWDAPIFLPTGDALAFSEVQPLSAVVGPVVWITGSRVLAYNVWLWLGLVLNGLFAARLLRRLGVGSWVAIGGGGAMVLLPIVHWQLGVEQLVPLWGVLWTWEAGLAATRRPSVGRGVVVGVAFSTAYLLCGHHGLFLSVLLLFGGVWCPGTRLFSRRGLACWAAAGVVAAVLAGPFVWKQVTVFGGHERFARPVERVRGLSVEPRDYLNGRWPQLIGIEWPDGDRAWDLGPGTLKVGLALLGIVWGLWRRRLRRWTLWMLTLGGLAFGLSQGPNLDLWGWQPWEVLAGHYPGFKQVRSVFRFAFFVQMVVVLLAAVGVQGLMVLGRRWVRAGWGRWSAVAVVGLLGATAVFEMPPEATRIDTVPDASRHVGWLTFVKEETPAGRGVLCLPMAPGRTVEDFEISTLWMYLGTFHGRPLVNGYSGFFPATYDGLQGPVNEGFPQADVLRWLEALGVEFVVVDRDVLPPEDFGFLWYPEVTLRHAYSDDVVRIDVYRVMRVSED